MYKRSLGIDQTNKFSTTNAFSFTGEQSFLTLGGGGWALGGVRNRNPVCEFDFWS